MPADPIVYAGPSLSRREAEAALPGATLRPPVRRGDLYRDRERGGAVFVMLDGVFLQQEAVSPREVLDILADGALVVGAASMGALRAAECWPAGMRGIGAIYRLYRRGCLTSDDEVALVFSPEDGYRPLSVPLINVRHALARAVRSGLLDRSAAGQAVRAAEETFYTERSWPGILAAAGLADPDGGLAGRLAGWDLKRGDALRALRAVARWRAADPHLCDRPRHGLEPFAASDRTRERQPAPLGGDASREDRLAFGRWQLLCGRATPHLLAIAAADPGSGLAERLRLYRKRLPLLAAVLGPDQGPAAAEPAVLRLLGLELWNAAAADEVAFAERLWAELKLAGELDAELFRWRAVREAAGEARRQGLAPRPGDRELAAAEIAAAHGCGNWSELRQRLLSGPYPWAWLAGCRDDLALAQRWREILFNPPPASRGRAQ